MSPTKNKDIPSIEIAGTHVLSTLGFIDEYCGDDARACCDESQSLAVGWLIADESASAFDVFAKSRESLVEARGRDTPHGENTSIDFIVWRLGVHKCSHGLGKVHA